MEKISLHLSPSPVWLALGAGCEDFDGIYSPRSEAPVAFGVSNRSLGVKGWSVPPIELGVDTLGVPGPDLSIQSGRGRGGTLPVTQMPDTCWVLVAVPAGRWVGPGSCMLRSPLCFWGHSRDLPGDLYRPKLEFGIWV